MIKLLKKMGKREVLMAVLCALLVLGQVYFDLTLPDYMTDLTMMLNTAGSETSDILNVGLKMLGCTLASAALAIVCGYLSAKTASGFSYTIREKLFNHVMDMGSEEMQDFSIPSLITRTTNDITQIQMIVSMGLQMIIKSPIMAVWAVIKILGKSWELSAVTAAFVVVICVFVLAVMATCIPRFRIVQKLTDKINRVARENLTGINVVHAFNAEKYQNDKFDVPSKEMMNTQLKNQRMFALMMPVMNIGMNGLTLAIYWLGAVLIQQIALTAVQDRITFFSNVVVFSTYATYVVMSFMMLVMIFMMLPAAQVSAERINEVLERDVNIKEGSVSEGREQGTVEFKNVSFRYPHASEDELSNISFKIEKGQTLAIIGATGSGKTTFLNALSEFIPKEERVVTIEDSAELQLLGLPNLVRLESRDIKLPGAEEITIRDLIKSALRMRPNRIIVGECRGAEALDVLQAMNTGHSGSLSTGHANSAMDMVSRLETMVLMGMDMPLAAIQSQIASAIDIIIQLGRIRDGSRKLLQVVEVKGVENGKVCLHELFRFREKKEQGSIGGIWEKKGELLYQEKLQAAGLS